jgi:nucleoside transporter
MQRTPPPTKARLCLMMFLQYFVQGSYLNIVSVYLRDALKFTDGQIGMFLAALAVGPILSPLVIGQLVDRMLPTERVLAGCHFLAGLLMLGLYSQTDYLPVLALGTLYSILYIPTMMLTNSLAFRHLAERDREFPLVRVWGTLGFIVPAWFIEFYFLKGLTGDDLNRARGVAFLVSGIGGLVLAAYSLTLPHTPPAPRGEGKFAPGVVLRLLKRRDFLVLTLVTFVIAGAHNFYFVWNGPLLQTVLGRIGKSEVQTFATIGQIAEIAVMAVVGSLVLRLGFKRTMLAGIAAYSLRCVALGVAGSGTLEPAAAVALAGLGNALHGACFGFFVAVAFMYVDKTSPPDVKGSMQTVYGTLIFGIGMVVGGWVAGALGNVYKLSAEGVPAVYDWNGIWLTCAAAAGACFVVFAAAFPRDRT